MNTQKLNQTIYVSAAATDFSPPVLRYLLDQSRRNNALANVTGMLFFYRDSFLQVLEGPAQGIETIMGKVNTDERHGDVKVLSSEPVEAKMFGEWSMGFVQANHAANLVDEYVSPGVPYPLTALNAQQAKEMLRFFKQVVGDEVA